MGTDLTPELVRIRDEIKAHAIEYGLDFFEVLFEMLDYEQINSVAALGGFPTRYPHWRFGMSYDQLSKGYAYGLQKIYEMVINTDPCYAYLLRANHLVDQKIVIAHVYGHCDFFKNNACFAYTNRKMMDEIANHASRIKSYQDKLGVEKVEQFIDRCLSLENLIDLNSPFIRRESGKSSEDADTPQVRKMKVTRAYMDPYINPKEFIQQEEERLKKDMEKSKKFPPEPVMDVLQFLIQHAPLENWQADILSIVREEAYYFAPQGQTKIMNEGWASYWHSKILTEKVLSDDEIVDYADHCAGVLCMHPGKPNPYKIGIEIFRDIEDRWNNGRFGREYEECDNWEERKRWYRPTNMGREKIFEVRKHCSDITFIDQYLTEELCERLKLYNYAYNKRTGQYEIVDKDFKAVREKLLSQLTNLGQPFIQVVDANYENRGELLIQHKHMGVDLDMTKGIATIQNLQAIWNRPVNLLTKSSDEWKIYRWDGKDIEEKVTTAI